MKDLTLRIFSLQVCSLLTSWSTSSSSSQSGPADSRSKTSPSSHMRLGGGMVIKVVIFRAGSSEIGVAVLVRHTNRFFLVATVWSVGSGGCTSDLPLAPVSLACSTRGLNLWSISSNLVSNILAGRLNHCSHTRSLNRLGGNQSTGSLNRLGGSRCTKSLNRFSI